MCVIPLRQRAVRRVVFSEMRPVDCFCPFSRRPLCRPSLLLSHLYFSLPSSLLPSFLSHLCFLSSPYSPLILFTLIFYFLLFCFHLSCPSFFHSVSPLYLLSLLPLFHLLFSFLLKFPHHETSFGRLSLQ